MPKLRGKRLTQEQLWKLAEVVRHMTIYSLPKQPAHRHFEIIRNLNSYAVARAITKELGYDHV